MTVIPQGQTGRSLLKEGACATVNQDFLAPLVTDVGDVFYIVNTSQLFLYSIFILLKRLYLKKYFIIINIIYIGEAISLGLMVKMDNKMMFVNVQTFVFFHEDEVFYSQTESLLEKDVINYNMLRVSAHHILILNMNQP